jgi:DNA-binding NarL/FixJ family response regulator
MSVPLPTFIVEDNHLVRQGLIEALDEVAGVEWLGSASGTLEAIAWLRRHRSAWRLLIVDLFLVNGSGLQILAECGDRAAEQRVVVVTNYATPEVRRRAAALGANAVFDKSTEVEELLDFCAQLAAT